MTILETLTYGTQLLFVVVALYVAMHTLRNPTRSNLYILLFFSLLVVAIAYSWIQSLLGLIPGPVGQLVTPVLVLALPYVLLRLADAFSSVPSRYLRAAEVGLLTSAVLVIILSTDVFPVLVIAVSYVALTAGLAAYRFHSESHKARGLTGKRLHMLSQASLLLGAALFAVAVAEAAPGIVGTVIDSGRQLMLSASALLYLIGFAPPALVRRAWQEPQLRHFLHQTLHLPRWSDQRELLREIEQATAETIGTPNAVIGLWNPETELVDYRSASIPPGKTIGGKAFEQQRSILSLDTLADDPESRDYYVAHDAMAVAATPITIRGDQLGVMAVYSPNPPIFAEDNLSMLRLLADHVAVLLENRRHLEAQAELAVREETTRLRDEFLSVAAHDLKTPLTTIVATAQYLERKLASTGEDSPEMRSITRLNREAKRLHRLVQSLLDTSRIERGQLMAEREIIDLSELVRDTLHRVESYATHNLDADIEENLVTYIDEARIQQVLENLLENARKYSPRESTIRVCVWTENEDEIRIAVSDSGMGIDPEEQSRVFERYYRTPASQDGDAPGIGLGLYICKQIIELHDGKIWLESVPGEGTTFHVSLHRVKVDMVAHGSLNIDR